MRHELDWHEADSHGPTGAYGVFILDDGDWRQVSAHGCYAAAASHARDAHDLLGSRVRLHSREGAVVLELSERPGGRPHTRRRPRGPVLHRHG